MNHNHWNRDTMQERIEEWREQRIRKMADRLQLNSNRPRTISSSVLGYGNYRQQLTVQPSHRQHSESPRVHHIDQRWNSNYNYSGHREHHSPHKQYHREQRGQSGGFNHHGQKRIQFSSHKSLYNDRKSTNRFSRKYSSCNNINSASENGNQDFTHISEQNSEIFCENVGLKSVDTDENISTFNIDCERLAAVSHHLENANTTIGGDLEIDNLVSDSNIDISECPIFNSTRHLDSCNTDAAETETVVNLVSLIPPEDLENLVSEKNAELVTSLLSESHCNVGNCSFKDTEINCDPSACDSNVEPGNSSSKSQSLFVDDRSTNDLTVEVSDVFSKHFSTEQQNLLIVNEESPVVKCTEKSDVLVSEPFENIDAHSAIAFETDNSSEFIPKVNEMSSETIIASESDQGIEIELNFSFKPETNTIIENSTFDSNVDTSGTAELNVEVAFDSLPHADSSYKDKENSCVRTSADSTEIVPVEIVATDDSNEEASTSIRAVDDFTKEIESVENKFADISIVNEDVCSNVERKTPMKRGRRKILLDATNILQSSTIKYAVREIRKNDESEIIVTPVRRSLRVSSVVTPVSKQKNICVESLEELSPDVIQKMKFVQNPAINVNPDC